MKTLLLSSLVFVFLIGLLLIPSANALPVSYNTTSINLGLTSVPRNSSSYDVFPLIPDNWLWEKFDNNTIDSGPLSVAGTVTYNTNLKGMWHFENNVNDATGNGNGVVTGTTTFVNGHEGQGFSFNGASYITTTSTPYNFERTNAFSVSFWFKHSSTIAANEIVIDKQNPNVTNLPGWGIRINNLPRMFFEIGNSAANLISVQNLANNIYDNNWHHIVWIYSGSGVASGVSEYVDGVSQSLSIAANTSTLTAINAVNLRMGESTSSTFPLTGVLDEVRIYNTNLSIAQTLALYMVGHYSQSHTFDGGEYVTVGSISSLNLMSNGNPFTYSGWLKVPVGGLSGVPIIFDNSGGGGLGNVGFTNFIRANGEVNFQVSNGGGVGAPMSLVSNTGVYPDDGAYHYIAFSFDGSNLSFYLDGSLIKTQAKSGTYTYSSSNPTYTTHIGVRSDGIANFLTGQWDNLKVYPYALSSSQITSDYNSISPISSGKQFMSYYNGKSGSATLTQKIGSTKSSLTLSCTPDSTLRNLASNNTKIYYTCPPSGNNAQVAHIDISSGTTTNDFVATNNPGSINNMYPFPTITKIFFVTNNGAGTGHIVSKANGNVSANSMGTSVSISNQKIFQSTTGFKYNYNGSSTQTVTAVGCELYYSPTAKNQTIDNINCDPSLAASSIRYWNGMLIQNIGSFSTNGTQQFLNSIDASAYKKLLSLPCLILVNETPCVTFIATDFTQTDYLVVLTSTHVYYGNAQTALAKLQTHNYALQSYDIITQGTSSSYEIQNPILQSMKLYGPINLNSTVSKAGLFTLPSGYTVKTTSIESAIRTIDPRWTNDATDIPIITSTSSLFPIFLTVSNAPVFSAIKVTNPYQLINSQEAVWAVAQLDSTRTVEFDLPSNVCVNVYVADISVSPSIWNFQGIICANGVNQKTISYTNTLPFTFWTYPWGASDSFTPNTNGLVTTVRHTTAPFSYNIVLKNSTGTVFQNTTYTSNSTIDTQNFNLTGRAKPVSLYISSVTGGVNQIYSAFLGSPISLASTASFFNQYFSYQGFNLLAFIPIIFASMFTRNTIGIGVVLTVLCIATLSWLSVVVIPELDIMIMIVIAIIGLIAYRLTYY